MTVAGFGINPTLENVQYRPEKWILGADETSTFVEATRGCRVAC